MMGSSLCFATEVANAQLCLPAAEMLGMKIWMAGPGIIMIGIGLLSFVLTKKFDVPVDGKVEYHEST